MILEELLLGWNMGPTGAIESSHFVMLADASTTARRVQAALEDIRAGKMVIVIDDEDRENEGDLCAAAQFVTPEIINFMAKHGRGLICLTLTDERVRQLGIPMMVDDNRSSRSTAFTVSIEARHGVTTGISAQDRAHTIRVAANPESTSADVVSPGHIFPLRARSGGVLQRSGHTEGSVDLARLAGCTPAAVICEIMKEDGSMARLPDLQAFAKAHSLRIVSIADLIEHRMRTERLVTKIRQVPVNLRHGVTWTAHLFELSVEDRQFLALSLGEISAAPTLVRVHTGSVLEDVFGAQGGSVTISDAMARIEEEGKGVLLYLPRRVRLVEDLDRHAGRPLDRQGDEVFRQYGLGAQVLKELGLAKIRLLTRHPRRMVGLESFGLEVVEQLPVPSRVATRKESTS